MESNYKSATFDNVLDAWLIHKQSSIKPSSYAKYYNIVKNHIKPSFGKYTPADITSELLNTYMSAKLKTWEHDRSDKLSGKTVKAILDVLKAAMKSVDIDIDATKYHPRLVNKCIRVFSRHEQASLERFLTADINESKLGVLLCLYTGLRIGEVCALKWSDISIDNAIVVVGRTLQRVQIFNTGSAEAKTRLVFTDPKSNCSARIIPIPDCLLGFLKQLRQESTDAFFLTGDTCRYIEPRTYQNHFKRYLKHSGVSYTNFHTTRHTFATRCVEAGFDIKSLSEILGHSSVKVTLDRYVHPTIEMKRAYMNKLDFL